MGLPRNESVAAMRKRTRAFWFFTVLLAAAFVRPLWELLQLTLNFQGIHSHILLVPLVSAYLFKTTATPFHAGTKPNSWIAASLVALLGILFVGAYWFLKQNGTIAAVDGTALLIAGFLLEMFAGALAIFGWPALKSRLFAISFLVFMIPLPTPAFEFASLALQRASADVAEVMLRATGMPVLRDGMMMHLPNLRIIVAEECSGIRSTFVLFMTSLIASNLFLRTGWKRALLVLAILPIAILRNAFRITTIAWLTVNVNPNIIHSPLHHRGGPVFFVLSLAPLFLLLWLLRKSEKQRRVMDSR